MYGQYEFLNFFQILMTHSQVMTNESFRVFSAKIDCWLEEHQWHKLYPKANIGTQVFFVNIEMKNIYVHMLASHFSHTQKNKIFKIDPTLNVII